MNGYIELRYGTVIRGTMGVAGGEDTLWFAILSHAPRKWCFLCIVGDRTWLGRVCAWYPLADQFTLVEP